MPLIRHPKRRGEWVELQFMTRAASHGLTVSKPWGDSARYDFIVDHRGRLSRVQVKSTTFNNGGFYMCNTVSRAPHRPPESYSPEQIDFFAAFIIPEDIWYIVPAEIIRTTRFAASLHPQRRDNKYFRYMEAWHLLRVRANRNERRNGNWCGSPANCKCSQVRSGTSEASTAIESE